MPSPPPDVDRERFILETGTYHNQQTARAYDEGRVFRIDPAPLPVGGMIALNALFAAFFGVVYWLVMTRGRPVEPWEAWGIAAVAALVHGGYTLGVLFTFRHARRRGPWLVYDKASGRVELPREGVSFARDEVVHLQYITTKRLSWGGLMNNDRLTELNLVTRRGDKRERWLLLASDFTDGAFDHVLWPLVRATDLPVVRVKDSWLGWDTTETPYGGRGEDDRAH